MTDKEFCGKQFPWCSEGGHYLELMLERLKDQTREGRGG